MSPKSPRDSLPKNPPILLSPVSPSPRELRSTTSKTSSSPSAQSIFNAIVRRIPITTTFTELVFDKIPPEEGDLLSRSLAASAIVERSNARVNYNSVTWVLWVRIMPTEIHDLHQRWVGYSRSEWRAAGLLSRAEDRLLDVGIGTRFDGFIGAYTSSSKEPDLFIRPDTHNHPLIVIESGWSESWPRLHADKSLWLDGTSEVNVVILLKWSKLTHNRVKATAEIWRRGGAMYNKAIFPAPNPAPAPGTDIIEFTRRELFGALMIAGRVPTDRFILDLEDLREYARERLAVKMGLVPA
ncbi:hypothetical protein BDV24DRAFT_164535 [Aspergillus arachidicola]|uniref:Uncharacterized protein n=1 Tax=Aspergillus arachidicola TaxID=656916 RepID=A0A2G7G695_9EURO|nr:hypothetical protein BDV24DRAFT_164535 [Aspergillus arachidicola]PIG88366.1 hypothetical protein AARAC_001398 [Aspergillus arachidicola]